MIHIQHEETGRTTSLPDGTPIPSGWFEFFVKVPECFETIHDLIQFLEGFGRSKRIFVLTEDEQTFTLRKDSLTLVEDVVFLETEKLI